MWLFQIGAVTDIINDVAYKFKWAVDAGLRKFTLGKNRIEFTLGCSDIVSSIDSLVKLYTFPFGYASGSLSLPRQLAH
jgi:hypothetical protein